jgi:hypothetical protein
MPEILRIAVSVGTPLSLLGLLVAVVYLAYMRKLRSDETKLKSLPPDKRATQTDRYLTRYGINGRDLSPDEKLALIKDELDKRHRRSRGYVIAATIAFVICFAIAALSFSWRTETADDPNAYQSSNGTISQPRDRATVNATFDASGTANNVGKGVYLWLAVEINGRIWPKDGRVTVDRNGQWNQSVFEDGHPDQFALSLWAANSDANVQLRAWLVRGQQTGVYPELLPLPGMKRLARVQGLRVDNQ